MPSIRSHLLPYAFFVAIGAATPWVPVSVAPWMDALRVAAAFAALLFFSRHGAYPELRQALTPCKGAALWAILAGLAAGLLWVPLTEVSPWTLGERGGYDVAGATKLQLAARLVGTLLVVPFAEELLVRSLIPRFVDAGDGAWTDRPVGRMSPLAVAISVGFFTLTHPEVLAALVAGVLWTALLCVTRRMRDVVLAHAVANGVLAVWVMWTGEGSWW